MKPAVMQSSVEEKPGLLSAWCQAVSHFVLTGGRPVWVVRGGVGVPCHDWGKGGGDSSKGRCRPGAWWFLAWHLGVVVSWRFCEGIVFLWLWTGMALTFS